MFKADLCLNKNSIKLKKGFIYCLYKFMMFTENVVENKIFIPKNIKNQTKGGSQSSVHIHVLKQTWRKEMINRFF